MENKTKLEKIDYILGIIVEVSICLVAITLVIFLFWYSQYYGTDDDETGMLTLEWFVIHNFMVVVLFVSYISLRIVNAINLKRAKKICEEKCTKVDKKIKKLLKEGKNYGKQKED